MYLNAVQLGNGNITAAGLGAYDKTGRWDWEYYPPPYQFLAPRNSAAMPPIAWPTTNAGLGDCGCGCKGSGKCGDGHNHVGMGLFDSGFDYTQWGAAEWAVLVVGGYLAFSIVGDLFSAGRGVRKGYKRVKQIGEKGRRRAALKKQYQRELSDLND